MQERMEQSPRYDRLDREETTRKAMLWAESDRDSCNESTSLGRGLGKPASAKCTTQEQVPQSWGGHRGFQ